MEHDDDTKRVDDQYLPPVANQDYVGGEKGEDVKPPEPPQENLSESSREPADSLQEVDVGHTWDRGRDPRKHGKPSKGDSSKKPNTSTPAASKSRRNGEKPKHR